MNWVRTNYEKLIIGLIALIGIIVAIIYIGKILSFNKEFVLQPIPPKMIFPETNQKIVESVHKLLDNADYIDTKKHGKAVLYLNIGPLMIDQDGVKKYIASEVKIHPPVENDWFFKYDLDILDTKILSKDNDYDGFTNIEEYNQGSSPRNSNSHPPLSSKLNFVDIEKEDYILRFSTYNAPDIGINRSKPLPRKSKLNLRINSRFFDDQRFIIMSYEEKYGKHPKLGIQVNTSELTIRDTYNNKDHILVYGENTNIPTFTAILHFNLKEVTTYQVKLGDTFSLPGEDDKVYTVKDISEEEVTLTYLELDPETNEPVGDVIELKLKRKKAQE